MKTRIVLAFLTFLSFLGSIEPCQAFVPEDRVQATTGLNVRSTPGGPLAGSESTGNRGIVLDGPTNAYYQGTLYTWYKVWWDDDLTGWSVQGGLSSITVYSLGLASANPDSGVYIYVGPNDILRHADLTTPGVRFFDAGTSVTLIAPTVMGTNHFLKWTRKGSDYSFGNTIDFTMAANYVMTAVFVPQSPPSHTLTVASSNPNSGVSITANQSDNAGNYGGSTTFTRTFNQNTVVTFDAPPADGGNNFKKWLRDGVDLTVSTTATVTMDADHTITAVYSDPTTYTITTSVSPPGSGTANGGGTYTSGQSVTVSATANSGYIFTSWTEGGSVASSSASYQLTASASRSLIANFVTLNSCPANESVPPLGVTVIAHGHQLTTGLPEWVSTMANAIAKREGDNIPIYNLVVVDDPFSGMPAIASFGPEPGSPAGFGATAAAVIKIDWTADSPASTMDVADAIYDFLASDFFNHHKLAEVPIHLIGHSRGTSLISRLAYRFGLDGITIDHVTSLDPHPVSLFFGDFSVSDWENIIFADNYFQMNEFPKGELVEGSYNVNLSGITSGIVPGQQHSQAHAYYYGTIPEAVPSDDGDGISIPADWYNLTNPRTETGWNFSKAGLVPRPTVGLNHLSSTGTGLREPLTSTASEWCNAQLRFQNEIQATVGQTVSIPYGFQGEPLNGNLFADLFFNLDDDRNPFANDSCFRPIGMVSQLLVGGYSEASFSWIPTAEDVGEHFLQICASNRVSHMVRYDYSFHKVVVNPVNTQPSVDLTVQSVSPDSFALTSGGSVYVSCTLRNLGNAASGSFAYTIALSPNQYGTAYVLGTFAGSSIGANGSQTVSQTVSIPYTVPAAAYYLTVFVDSRQQVTEVDEGNNIGSTTPSMVSISSPSYIISATVSPFGAGTVTGVGSFQGGAIASLAAQATTGYAFVNWTEAATVVSTQANFSFAVSANRSLVANFGVTPLRYTLTPSAGANGRIIPNTPQTVDSGGSVSFSANPAGGYGVDQWFVDGVAVQTGGTGLTLISVTASASVQVTFKTMPPPTYTIAPSAGDNGSISPSTPQAVISGGGIAFTATPASGYLVDQWLVNSVLVQSGGASFTLNNVGAATSVQVTFKPVPLLRLTGMSVSNGLSHFVLHGPAGSSHIIQTSSNLVDWTVLTTNVIPADGERVFDDPLTKDQTRRFYRALPLLQGPWVLQPGPADGKDIWTTSFYSYAPDSPYPGGGQNDNRLRVGGWGDEYYSLLQFDLNGLPTSSSSAVLYLYCYGVWGGGTPLCLDRITQPWDWRTMGTGRDRERLWWADKPETLQWSSSELPTPAQEEWYAVDITDLYNAWQSGTYPNYGLEFRPALFLDNNFVEFYSADYSGDPTLRPKLVITGAN